MSEAEYHAIFDDETDFNAAAKKGNSDWRYSGFVPITSMDDATATSKIYDLVGNGWEWTSTPFYGFPGFEPMENYQGYSSDFFDGKHFVIKGAGPFTGKSCIRMSFRNWFQSNYPHVMAKFRIVK